MWQEEPPAALLCAALIYSDIDLDEGFLYAALLHSNIEVDGMDPMQWIQVNLKGGARIFETLEKVCPLALDLRSSV